MAVACAANHSHWRDDVEFPWFTRVNHSTQSGAQWTIIESAHSLPNQECWIMRWLACVFLNLLALPLSAEDNWPQFRGPHANGTSEAKGLPTKWSERENVKWKTPLHDKGWSSPVIWGDQIWMTAATEDGKVDFAI